MAAMTGATATRSWLQAQHATWMTPRRLRVATIGIFSAAIIGSSVTMSGSTPAPHQHQPAPMHQAATR